MKKVLLYNCLAGISGDMNLAALLDLGVPLEHLNQELSKLHLPDPFHIHVEKASQSGIFGTRVKVKIDHHHHDHDHPKHEHHHHHTHGRSFADIKQIIVDSHLSDQVKTHALSIFSLLAETEAQVHGRTPEEIHFHEVGAVDSIVDIIGAAICLDYLKVDSIASTTVELGSGSIRCEHGTMAVPAPATALLAEKFPSSLGGTDHEATTPTGAAILAASVQTWNPKLSGQCLGNGTGIGHRTSEKIPNILRVSLYQCEDANTLSSNDDYNHVILTSNIDDMSSEHLAYLMEKLFETGCDDAWQIPISMKKGRLATQICVLCHCDLKDKILSCFFKFSSTLGIREIPTLKHVLPREIKTFKTEFGPVSIKLAENPDQSLKSKIEFEDCKRISRQLNIPLSEVITKLNETFDS